MDGFLSFLFFALLFYVMMRFGCGAHMVHGHHGGGLNPRRLGVDNVHRRQLMSGNKARQGGEP